MFLPFLVLNDWDNNDENDRIYVFVVFLNQLDIFHINELTFHVHLYPNHHFLC